MKKFSGIATILATLVMTFAFIGCPNNPSSDDPLSGHTYKVTSINMDGNIVTKSGPNSFTQTAGGNTIVITKVSSTSYTLTINGADMTSTANQDDLADTYEEFSGMFEMSIVFSDGTVTFMNPGEEPYNGTYSVSGNTVTLTLDGESSNGTTNDNWATITGNGTTYTRQ